MVGHYITLTYKMQFLILEYLLISPLWPGSRIQLSSQEQIKALSTLLQQNYNRKNGSQVEGSRHTGSPVSQRIKTNVRILQGDFIHIEGCSSVG
jgi:hypothetical protein